jgi:hypothetical protein
MRKLELSSLPSNEKSDVDVEELSLAFDTSSSSSSLSASEFVDELEDYEDSSSSSLISYISKKSEPSLGLSFVGDICIIVSTFLIFFCVLAIVTIDFRRASTSIPKQELYFSIIVFGFACLLLMPKPS